MVMEGSYDKRTYNGFCKALRCYTHDKDGTHKTLSPEQQAVAKALHNCIRFFDICMSLEGSRVRQYTNDEELFAMIGFVVREEPNFKWPLRTQQALLSRCCTRLVKVRDHGRLITVVFPWGAACFDPMYPLLSAIRLTTKDKLATFVKIIFTEIVGPAIRLGDVLRLWKPCSERCVVVGAALACIM